MKVHFQRVGNKLWKLNQKIMVEVVKQNDKELFQCTECGFHYENRDWAERCEVWCREHKSCNIEITASAEENKGAG